MSVNGVIAGGYGPKMMTASQIIGAASRSTVALIGGEVKRCVSDLFDEIGFVDDHAADYRVFFNGANFRDDDDNLEIQFIYVGYTSKRKSLHVTLGKIIGDNLALNYGALVNIDNTAPGSALSWFKGGEFKPAISVKTSGQFGGDSRSKLEVLDEDVFLRTSLDYVRSFQELAVVELKDARSVAGV